LNISPAMQSIKRSITEHKKVTAIVIIVLLVAAYGIYRSTQQPDTASQSTAQAEAIKGPIEVTVTGTGTITPVTSEEIGPKAAGTLKKIYVKNGDRVKKGDVLMEITNDSLNLQMQTARLDMEKAGIDLADSSSQLVSDTLTASFSGRVVNLEVKAGDDVSKNAVLATLQDDSQLVFDMPVDNNTAQKVALNQQVEVFLPDRDETVNGRVTFKSNQSVSGYSGQNRAYLKVAVAATGSLAPNMKAFGVVTVGGKQVDALAVSTLQWMGQTQIKAPLAGKLTGIYVQEGQAVKKGQKLFAFDDNSVRNQQKTQQVAYEQAQLNMQDLADQVNELVVKAPVDGVVSGLEAKEGDDIGTSGTSGTSSKSTSSQSTSGSSTSSSTTSSSTGSTTSLGKIINNTQMEVSFPVDEVDIAKVKIDQNANISVDALPDQVFQGKVTEIAEEGTVTNNVSSFEVTILLDNQESLLKSGMTANVTIVVAKKDNVVLIPIEALQERGKRKFVIDPTQPVQAQGQGQRQNMKPVTVGLTNESYAEIVEGLKEGDKVLLPGQQTSTGRTNSMVPGFGSGGRSPVGGEGRNPMGGGGSSRTGG